MQNRPRAIRRLSSIALAACAALATALPSTAGSREASLNTSKAQVSIAVKGLRSGKGVVHVCMTSRANSFPSKNCQGFRKTVPARSNLVLTFSEVPSGRYAVALVHDENANGKMDMAMGLMPREGFGFSRDPKVLSGPPQFSSAAFNVGTGDVRQTIKMRYLL